MKIDGARIVTGDEIERLDDAALAHVAEEAVVTKTMSNEGWTAAELAAITRRAFLPKVFIQLWKATPWMAAMISHAQVASGGLSPITVPLQGNPMVTIQNIGYDGSFNQPGVTPGLQNAEFNLKGYLTAIPFLGLEGLVQLDYSVVPLIEARMNDATNVTLDKFATDMFTNVGNTQSMIGLPAAVDDGTFAATYGGLTRSANTFWKSTYVHNTAPTTPTRNLLLQYISQVTKVTGEIPKMGLCGHGTWALLAQDFTPNERYVVTPTSAFGEGKVEALFRALDVAGVPVGTVFQVIVSVSDGAAVSRTGFLVTVTA